MSAQKPPSGQNHRSPRSKPIENGKTTNNANISNAVALKRNAALLQQKATQKKVHNSPPKQPKQILRELLHSIKIEAEQSLASRDINGMNGHKKRPAPPPPLKVPFPGATGSAPDLASAPASPRDAPRRSKLRKSLSLSGSRMLFHNFLIRISSKRRSRSQDSIFDMGYLDQDQQVVRNAAVKAQQRRGTVHQMPHSRSLSAEPRSQPTAVGRDPTPDRGGSPRSKRPDKLFIGSPSSSKKRFRERSPLVKTPVFIHERPIDQVDGARRPRRRSDIKENARREIEAFEQIISDHLQFRLPSTNL